MKREETSPHNIRYQADEKVPWALAFGLGFQHAILCIASIVLVAVLVARAGSGSEGYVRWVAFGALAISGVTTILQVVRVGRIGAGHVLLMGTSGTFIAASIAALKDGGPALHSSLVVISAIFQFLLAWNLSLFRRIITPVVSATVIMLIAVTIMPIAFDSLKQVPAGAHPLASPFCAAITLLVIVTIALACSGQMRLWGPVAGILAGSISAIIFGIYDFSPVAEAAWIGFPSFNQWPGFDLNFGREFWILLPSFIFVTMVGAIETIGDSIAIQQVSWRKPRAISFKAVQGALNADGMGNLLSGLMGTMPNTTYSGSISVTELTGVAARRVGVCIGILFIVISFSPKILAALIGIPGPIVASYLLLLLAILFVLGMKTTLQDGLDYRKGIILGVSFWIGTGFQGKHIFSDQLGPWLGSMLENGMAAGGLCALTLTLLSELLGPRAKRLKTDLSIKALSKIEPFLRSFARQRGLDKKHTQQLCAIGEEGLLNLTSEKNTQERTLTIIARKRGAAVELEFIAASDSDNLEDRLATLRSGRENTLGEQKISLRLLEGLSSSVRHQQYHDVDVVTIRLDVA